RRREKELRDILETIPAMTVTVLPDGSDVFIGKQFVEYSGLSADKARRSGWKVTISPDDLDQHVSKWRASLASGEPIEIESRFRRADGEYRWFLARAMPLRDDGGNILNWYEVLTDIEDRKRAEAALRNSEEVLRRREKELRDILETIPAMTVTVLPDGSDVFIGKQFVEYSGLSADKARRSGWKATIHPDDMDQHVSTWRASLVSGDPIEIESRFRRADGEYRWFLARAKPLRDDRDNILNWYEVLTDIEDRKRAEAALRNSEEVLRRREKELRDILETIPAMTVTVLPDGSDVFIGKQFVEYSGLSADKA